ANEISARRRHFDRPAGFPDRKIAILLQDSFTASWISADHVSRQIHDLKSDVTDLFTTSGRQRNLPNNMWMPCLIPPCINANWRNYRWAPLPMRSIQTIDELDAS